MQYIDHEYTFRGVLLLCKNTVGEFRETRGRVYIRLLLLLKKKYKNTTITIHDNMIILINIM